MTKSKYRIINNSPKYWESTGKGKINGTGLSETFARIYESMLRSSAWKSLTTKQKLLYVYCKAQYFGKRKPSYDFPDLELDETSFYFHKKQALDYGLYSDSTLRFLYSDMRELEKKGFIEIVASGRPNHMKSIYKFSGKWQLWEQKKDKE